MEGFTKLPKMQHFKEGGSVQKQIANYEKRERKVEEKADINQDKAIVKKAIKMHDVQEHKGEKTDLSKLRKGGRAKKDCGTVKKYKAGGNVTNVYEAKKASGDLDAIQKVKQIKPEVAAAPSKAAVKAKTGLGDQKSMASGDKDATKRVKDTSKIADAPSKGSVKAPSTPAAFCGGKSVKSYQVGGSVFDTIKDAVKGGVTVAGKKLYENTMGTPEQNKIGQENLDKQAAQGSKLAKMLGGKADAPSAPVNQEEGTFNKKRGGKVC